MDESGPNLHNMHPEGTEKSPSPPRSAGKRCVALKAFKQTTGNLSRLSKTRQHPIKVSARLHRSNDSLQLDDDFGIMGQRDLDVTEMPQENGRQLWIAYWRIPSVRVLTHTIFSLIALVLNVVLLCLLHRIAREASPASPDSTLVRIAAPKIVSTFTYGGRPASSHRRTLSSC
jgi:hypothetical protein